MTSFPTLQACLERNNQLIARMTALAEGFKDDAHDLAEQNAKLARDLASPAKGEGV